VSKRLHEADYTEVLRQRLYRGEKASSPSNPTTASSCQDLATSTPPLRSSPRKSLSARSLWWPVIPILAGLVLLPLGSGIILGGFWGEISFSASGLVPGADVAERPDEALAPKLVVLQGHSDDQPYAGVEAEPVPETVTQLAERERAVLGDEIVVLAPELPVIPGPEVTLALIEATSAAAPVQSPVSDSTPGALPESSARPLSLADRDLLVNQGNERLARGDVSGARLVYLRAAESGDARAAIGMGRTFDPTVLQMLRVYGIRPDPDQAAFWYTRSKALETRASQ
jgi:hypothetical protein